MKRIYLIDCPGVVPPSRTDTEEDILLRGVVRVENVENPEQYMPAVLRRTKPQYIERTYGVKGYKDSHDFLSILARKGGRLLKGGEPDLDSVAKMVISDFLRGKVPWFTPPPYSENAATEKETVDAEAKKDGDRDDDDEKMDESEDDEEFEGFDSEEEISGAEED